MMPEEKRAEEATPQETPTSNSDLGRFKSLEAKQRALRNLKAPRRPGDPPLNPNNLGGRPPKDGPATRELRKMLRAKFPGDPQGRTYLKLVVESLIKSAIKGNIFAQQLLWERYEGRLPMPELTDLPVNIVVQVNRNQPRYPELKKSESGLLIEADTSESKAND